MCTSYTHMSDIAYEQIEGDFWYGAYGVFRIVMVKDTGFVNVTKLCADGGKDYKNWFANAGSRELLTCLAYKLGEDGNLNSCLVQRYVHTANQTPNQKIISGTYMHPLIIPHVACWISPDFALRVSDIINDFIIGEYKRNYEEARFQMNKEKCARVLSDQLLELTEKQVGIMRNELAIVDDQLKEKETLIENNDIEMTLKNTQLAVTEMSLHSANHKNTKNHVHMAMLSSTHSFLIMKVNDANAPGDYYVIRRKRKNMSTTIKKFQIRHPNAGIMYHQKFAPNGVNLFLRLKAQRIVITHQNYFNIATCEHELVKCISAMCCDNIRPPIVNFST